MSRAELEKKAFDYFNTGLCCSKSLSKTIIDHFAEKPENYTINVATGFCGGIGRTHADLCGAVAWAVLAVGYLYGRTEKGKDFSKVSAITSEFRRQFIEAFGSTDCAAILGSLGEQEKYVKCKQLPGEAAGMLYDILVAAKSRCASERTIMRDVEVKFLGSGGRLQSCVLVTYSGGRFLIDCGASALIGMNRYGVDPTRVNTIFISHTHGDHCGGIPFLMIASHYCTREASLFIYCRPARHERMDRSGDEIFFPSSSKVNRRFPLEIAEFRDRNSESAGSVTVTCIMAIHPSLLG